LSSVREEKQQPHSSKRSLSGPPARGSTPIISIGIDHGEWLKTQMEELEDEVNGEQTIGTFKSEKRANE